MAGGAFGSCVDLHATWTLDEDAFGNPQVTFTSNVEGQEPVSICLNSVKGALVNGEVQTVANGLLILDELFGSGVVSSDGSTYTVTFPNQDPQEICLTPVKQVTQGDDGVTTVSYADGEEEEIQPSYAESNGNGTTTTYHPDGSEHTTSDSPVLTINGVGPDVNGNVNPADLFSNTVDNGDGTFTTTNSDGTALTWSGDTFASQSDNGDGTVTITFSDGSAIIVPTGLPASAVDNADGTCTLTIGTKTLTVPNGVQSTVVDNGNGGFTITQNDGSTATLAEGPISLTNNGDATATISIGGVDCDLSTLRYDSSDPCFHILRNTKSNAVVARWAVEGLEFSSVGRSENTDITNDLNDVVAGDTLTYEVCQTYTNPSNCCIFAVEHVSHTSFGMSVFQMPTGWYGTATMYQSIDGGAYVTVGVDLFDTRDNVGPVDFTCLGTGDFLSSNGGLQPGATRTVCTRIEITVDERGANLIQALTNQYVAALGHKQICIGES